MQLKPTHQPGFTLVEMLISLALMAIVLALAVPNFSVWLMNHQIRNAADTAMASLQLARAEAIRTNTAVQLSFDADTKKIWQIKRVDTGAVLQQKNFAEDAPKVAITPTPAAVTTVTFNGLGRISDATKLTQLDFDSTTISSTNSKDMCITLQAGGALKLKLLNSSVASGGLKDCS